ncbi:MAG: SGNH/GDSL hydrolase family protein, partial [Betaproteobacteria bacterium]
MTILRLRTALFATAATIFLASCGGSDFTSAPVPAKYSSVYTFGASLTDTGNACPPPSPPAGCPPVPPYAAGLYSNGQIFSQIIAANYGAQVLPSGKGGTAYSVGGARTGAIPGLTTQSPVASMVAQVDSYLKDSGAQANAQFLYLIDATTIGNNITAGLPLIQAGTITSTQLVTAAIGDVVGVVNRLYAAGARNFLVVNAPNVGATPLAQSQGTAAATAATQLSAGFNQNLAAQLNNLKANAPGMNIFLLDNFGLETQIKANPSSFGFSNVTAPCVTPTSLCGTTLATQNTFFYWDGFH